jgi:hypothetical protein
MNLTQNLLPSEEIMGLPKSAMFNLMPQRSPSPAMSLLGLIAGKAP